MSDVKLFDQETPMSDETKKAQCPFPHAAGGGTSNRDWWPNQLRLDLLHQHSSKSNPMGEGFDYAKEFRPRQQNLWASQSGSGRSPSA